MKLQEHDVFAGRYRLLRRIGSGGFSVVWLAADQMTEDSEVALKIYVPEKGMDRQGIKMFVREYKIVANLHHSGLLKATHFDVYDGSPFLVMPYCSAGSLHSRIMERGSLPEGEIAEVLEQTAGALAFLHSKEVVYQDIKPDNVLIDGDDNYLLTDFGISSRMRSTMRKSTGRKEAMTVAYAPPERFGGKAEVLPAGDVFSLGVMMYEMATGEVPWMAAGGAMLRPDSIPLELPEGYSRELESLMQACVSYSPDERPTAEEVQAAASSYRNTGLWGTVGGGSDGGSRIWLWVLVALAVLGGGYGVYSLTEGGGGPGSESQPVVVDSPAVDQNEAGDSLNTDQEEIGSTASEEDEQAAEASAWASAERKNTKGSYEGYLDDYPNGAHARQAERKLSEFAEAERKERERQAEARAWAAAERRDTKAGYEGYLEDYAEGAHARQARSKIKDIEARERAEAERRREVLKSPAGKVAKEIAATMVEIDGGSFRMGCTTEQGVDCNEDEHPVHEVYVSDFALNKYEVTQKQWRAIMGSNSNPEVFRHMGCKGCPVDNVTWNDAQKFIRDLNRISGEDYRLPTEAEWEYAARGGQQSRAYKYSGGNHLGAIGWYIKNAKKGNDIIMKHSTSTVGGRRPNELGLYDMSGNVWEWCSDWYASDYYDRSSRNNPQGPSSGDRRVRRGGSWLNDSRYCRVSFRDRSSPIIQIEYYGFRLAR